MGSGLTEMKRKIARDEYAVVDRMCAFSRTQIENLTLCIRITVVRTMVLGLVC